MNSTTTSLVAAFLGPVVTVAGIGFLFATVRDLLR